MNPDDYRDGLDASSSPWNDGDGGGGGDDDDASSLPPREAHDGKKIPRVFAGWRLHILPPRRQQRRPRERRGSSRFDDHDAFTPLSRGAAAARRDDDDRDFDFDERSDASTTPGGSSAPAVYFGDGGAPGGARQNARVRSRTSHDNVTVYPRDETAHPYVHPFRASASADDDDDDDDGALNHHQPALRSFWDERSPDSDVASKTSAGLDFTRHLDDSEDGTWRDELDDYASEEDGEGDRGGFYGRPSPSYPAFSPSPRGRTRARRIPRLTAVRLNAEENNAEDDAEEDAGDPGALVDFLGRVATGAPMLRLTRDFFHRDGLLGTGAFKRAEIRAHVAPDAAVGWRGVAYDGGSAGERGGGRKDAPFTLSLDAEAALAPQGEKGGTRARVTTGVHAQFAVMPGTFPDERLTAGLSVEALAQSERLSRAEREEIRFETGRRAPKRAPRLRRRNTLWARLRLWRGLFVRVASRVKIEPDGAGGNDVSFGAPRVEFHVEYDPKLEDKRADARWDFTRPRSAPVYVGRPIAFPGLGGLGGALKGLRNGVVGLGLGGGSGSGSGSVATNLDVTIKVTDADGTLLQVGDDPYEDEDAAYVENVVRRMPTNATLEAARKKEEREKKKEEDRARRERDKRDKRQREEDARAEKKRQDAAKRERARLEREERLELQKEKVAEQKKLMEARRKDAAEAKAAEAEAALRAAEKGSAAAASSTSTTTAKDATTATTEWKNARSDAAAVAVAAAAAAEARRRANKEAEAARKREEAEAARAERKRLEDEARLNREETRVAEANARKRAEEEARLSREAAKKAAEDARRAAEEDAAAAREAKRRLEREAAEAAARSKKLREDAERDTKRAEADRKETERLAAEKRRIEEETRRTLMRREEKERKRREREEDRNRRDAEMARRKAERDAEEDEKRAKKAAMETRRRIERNEAREKRWAEEARRKELKKEEERRQREEREREDARKKTDAEREARRKVEIEEEAKREVELANRARVEREREAQEMWTLRRERDERLERRRDEERSAERAWGGGETASKSPRTFSASEATLRTAEDAARAGFDPGATIALVPGHWIDPGEEVGAPGERALNLVITNRAHKILGARGWTVLRPDLANPPLAWPQYMSWVREQSRAGVSVLEVHGQGSGAKMDGRVTGVIAQDDSNLGAALASRFGRFPMNWEDLAIPRCGGAVVESFDATELEALSAVSRSAAVDAIAGDIADAVDDAGAAPPPREGCSPSGCVRGSTR